jgi:hypothetical protein
MNITFYKFSSLWYFILGVIVIINLHSVLVCERFWELVYCMNAVHF